MCVLPYSGLLSFIVFQNNLRNTATKMRQIQYVSQQDYREHIKVVHINTKYLSAFTNEKKTLKVLINPTKMLYIHFMIICTTFMYGIYAKRSKMAILKT